MGRAANGLGVAIVVSSMGLGGAALAQPAAQPPGVSESAGTGTFSRAQRSSVPYTLAPQQPR